MTARDIYDINGLKLILLLFLVVLRKYAVLPFLFEYECHV